MFFGVGSFVAALRGPLFRWMIHDRGGPSKSERIGLGNQAAGTGQVGRERPSNSAGNARASPQETSEQIGWNRPSKSGDIVLAKIRTECCQLLLPMPEAEVSAGVKDPCVRRRPALGRKENQRAWVSGVGVWSQRTSRFTSIARAINHFESAEPRSEVEPIVLWRWIVCRGLTRTADALDHTRLRKTEQIGRHSPSNESESMFGRRVDHEKHELHESSETRPSKSRAAVRTIRQESCE